MHEQRQQRIESLKTSLECPFRPQICKRNFSDERLSPLRQSPKRGLQKQWTTEEIREQVDKMNYDPVDTEDILARIEQLAAMHIIESSPQSEVSFQ